MSRHRLRLEVPPPKPIPISQTSTERRYGPFQGSLSDSADLFAMLQKSQEIPLWQLNIVELAGHNIEARGREEVNRLLDQGWVLLHIYTLRYEEDGIWRERPMAILGRPGK